MSLSKLERYDADPMVFLQDLRIPSAHGPRRFADVMAPFQRERFLALAPALLAVKRNQVPPVGRHWWEATKGASKDSDLAACLLWLLAFVRRPLDCQVGAADADQADELRKAARDILHLNAWLANRVAVQNRRIVCEATGAACVIIAADTAGSHGARPDVVIINELSHINKQEFAENLMDNAAKVPHGLAVVATNAGFLDTWQWRWRELARESDRWSFHKWDQPAPWLNPAEIEEAKRRNSNSRYLRLWRGVWAAGAGDALDPDDVTACTDMKAGPMFGDEEGWNFDAGLDLGIKHDRSALVVIGTQGFELECRLANCEAWSAGPSGEVDLAAVELGVEQAAWQYNLENVLYDPHQCEFMAQRLRRRGVHMVPVYFVGKQLDRMASLMLQVFRSHSITLYPDRELIRDLGRLTIVEKSYGYKLEAPRDKTGHADRATALALSLLASDFQKAAWRPPLQDLGLSVLDPDFLQRFSNGF